MIDLKETYTHGQRKKEWMQPLKEHVPHFEEN